MLGVVIALGAACASAPEKPTLSERLAAARTKEEVSKAYGSLPRCMPAADGGELCEWRRMIPGGIGHSAAGGGLQAVAIPPREEVLLCPFGPDGRRPEGPSCNRQ